MQTRTAALTALLSLALAACGQPSPAPDPALRSQALSTPDGTYEIVSRLSAKALDVQGWSGQDGAAVQQWSPTHNANQQWRLTQQADGSYQVAAVHSGKVLDVDGGSEANSAAVVQWTWNGGANQRWSITPTRDGYVKLTAQHSGKVLDVVEMSQNDGALVQQYTDYGNLNQLWKLVPVGAPAPVAPGGDPPVLDQRGQPIAVKAPPAGEALPGGAVFVSPQGSDAGDGSLTKPYQTLKQALTAAQDGAAVVLRGGTYRLTETLNVGNNSQLVQAYPGEQVWLRGSAVVTGFVPDGTAWRKDGWTAKFTPVERDFVQADHPEAGHLDMAYLDGRSLRQVMERAQLVSGTFSVDETNQKLYLGDDPGGHTVEATVTDVGLTTWGAELGTTIRGIGFAHFASMGLKLGQVQQRVLDNTFVWNGVQGALSNPTSAAGSLYQGNTFSFNGEQGLGGHVSDGTRVENNTFTYNNVDHFRHDWGAAGVKFCASKNMVFKRNVVAHNDSTGIWMDCGVNDAAVVGNTVWDNGGIGIFMEISKGAIIANNLVTGNGFLYNDAGIRLANSAGARIYNNTLVGNRANIGVSGWTRDPSPWDQGLPVNYLTEHLVIKNNILADATTTQWPLAQLDVAEDPGNPAAMIDALDFNAYVRSKAGQPQHIIRWMPLDQPGNEGQFKTLAAFQTRVGLEQHGQALDNTPLSEVFVNPGAGDYRLRGESRLTGLGEALPQDVAATLGVPGGQPVDPGVLGR